MKSASSIPGRRFPRRGRAFLAALIAAACVGGIASAADAPKPIHIAEVKRDAPLDFARDVAPLLERNCTACHNGSVDEGGLNLEDPKRMLKGGRRGPAIVVGKGLESLLVKFAAHRSEPVMPPEDNDANAKNLTPEELGLIKLWIDQGALGEGKKRTATTAWQPLPAGVTAILSVATTDDGRWIACSRANQVSIYQSTTGREITRLTDPDLLKRGVYGKPGVADLESVFSIAFSPDGTRLATGGYRTAKIWQRPENPKLHEFALGSPVRCTAVSPDAKLLAAALEDHSIRLFDLTTGQPGKTLAGHAGPVTSVVFSKDGSQLASASADRSVRVWNVADGALAAKIDTPAPNRAVAFVLDDKSLASAGDEKTIRLWSSAAGAPKTWDAALAGAVAAASAPDQGLVAVAGADGNVRVVTVADARIVKTLSSGLGKVSRIQWNGNATRLAVAHPDAKSAAVWDVNAGENGTLLASLAGDPNAETTAVALHPAGSHLVSADAAGGLRLWKVDAPAVKPLDGANGTPAAVTAQSEDLQWLATAGTADGKPAIFVRDLDSGKLEKTLLGHEGVIQSLAFSKDGGRIVSGSDDKTARVWNWREGNEIAKFAGHGGAVTAAVFTPNGEQVATAAADGSFKLWKAADAAEVKALAGHGGLVTALAAIGHEGGEIVSASADQTVRFWNAASGDAKRQIAVGQPVSGVGIAKDEQRLAAGSADGKIRLYQLPGGQLQGELVGQPKPPTSLAFHSDGARLLAAGGGDAPAVVWNVKENPPRIQESISLKGGVTAARFAKAAETVVAGGADGSLSLHPLRVERLFDAMPKRIVAAAYHRDGNRFYAASEDGLWRLYPTNSPKPQLEKTHGGPIADLAISPDGRFLATAGENKQVRLWNPDNGSNPQNPNLEGFSGPVLRAAFSSDGKFAFGVTAAGECLAFLSENGQPVQAFRTPNEAVAGLAVGPAANPWVVVAGKAATQSAVQWVRSLEKNSQPVNVLAVSPTERQMLISGGDDGIVRWFDVNSGNVNREWNHGGPVTGLAIRPDGRRVVSASANNTARMWDAGNNQMLVEVRADLRAQTNEMLRNQDLLLARGDQGEANQQAADAEKNLPTRLEAVKKAETAKAEKEKVHGEKVAAAAKADEEKAKREAAASEAVKAAAAAEETQKTAEAARVAAEAARNAANQAAEQARAALAAKADDAGLIAAKAEKEKAAAEAEAALKAANEAKQKADQAIQPTKQAASQAQQQAQAYQKEHSDAQAAMKNALVDKTQSERALEEAQAAHKKAEAAVPATKEAKAKADEKVKASEAAVQQAQAQVREKEKPLRGAAFAADGSTFATVGDAGNVFVWDGETGRPVDVYEGHAGAVGAVAYLPDGRGLASAGVDGKAIVWNLAPEWKLERTIGSIDGGVFVDRVLAVAFSADGKLLAAGGGEASRSGELKLFNVADGSLVKDFVDPHSDTILAVAFSRDGSLVATASSDKFVKVWNVADGKLLRPFEGHTHHVLGVAWHARGKILASSGADNVVKVWNLETGEQARTIPGFGKHVTSIQFLGASDLFATSSGDQNVRLHNATNGGAVRTFGGAPDYVNAVAGTPDGNLVAAGGQDGVLRIYNGQNGQLIREVRPPAPQPTTVAGAK